MQYYRSLPELVKLRKVFIFVTEDTQYVLQNFNVIYGGRQSYHSSTVSDIDYKLVLAPAGTASNADIQMCLLTFCDHLIITSGSTYSWWAAYLLQNRAGKVVFNKDYLINGTYLFTQFIRNDYMFPSWIGI